MNEELATLVLTVKASCMQGHHPNVRERGGFDWKARCTGTDSESAERPIASSVRLPELA